MKSKTNKERKIDSYPNGMELIKAEATAIFLRLAEKTPTQVGYEFGLDRFYSSDASIRAAVHKGYMMVLEDPEAYDIPIKKAGEIQKIVSGRALSISKDVTLSLRERRDIEKAEITDLVTSARDNTFRLLNEKLDMIGSSKKSLKEAKLSDLTRAGAMLFDKGQIVRGEATKNVAILSKIDKNMTAEEALNAVVQMQENIAHEKEVTDQKKK